MRNVIRNVAASASAQVHSVENSTFFPRTHQPLQLVHSNGSFSSAKSNGAMSNVSVGYSNSSFGSTMMIGNGEGYHTGITSTVNHPISAGVASPTPSGSNQRTVMEDVDGVDNDGGDGPLRGRTTFYSLPMTNSAGMRHYSPVATMSPSATEAESGGISDHGNLHGFRSMAHKNSSIGTSISQPRHKHTGTSHGHSSNAFSGSSTGAAVGVRGSRTAQAHAIIICGPAGIGKSSLIQMHQTNWRRQGLWGHAKMVKGEASPFTGLVSHVSELSFSRNAMI
jgi:hypothetical protein